MPMLQEILPNYSQLGSSHSSDRSSRGCTPPLSGATPPDTRISKTTPSSGSSSTRSGSKLSDVSLKSTSSKSHRNKKKTSKTSIKLGTAGLVDTSHDTNSSVFSPASQPTSPNARSSSKNSNYPSTSSFASYTSLERKKKKSWVSNAISPTYRQRCEEVRKNFPGLPANEMLIGDYSCALQKDILVHGRIYITTNYLCFYANIFRWETAVSIPWKEVL